MMIGIFRLQLFKSSEGFIAAQAFAMRRFEPLFIGRKIFSPNTGAQIATPNGRSGFRGLMETASIVLFRRSTPFVRVLGERRIDLLHSHFAVDAVYALPLARKLAIPLVTTLHGFDVTRSKKAMLASLRPAWINGVLLERSLQRGGDLFLCVSSFIRDRAIERGYPRDKVIVFHSGIDTVRLSLREGAGEEGLIVHVGRLVEKKGTKFLLRAVAQIRDVPGIQLVVLGDGPLRDTLEAEAQALGISDSVRFLGAQPNDVVVGWMRRAAVLATPSVTASDGDREGLPTVNMEASAQGVPVVASRSGGIADSIQDGRTGFLHDEGDVDALARQLRLVLGDADLRLRLGRGGRELITRDFDIHKQTAKLEDIYAGLIAKRKA